MNKLLFLIPKGDDEKENSVSQASVSTAVEEFISKQIDLPWLFIYSWNIIQYHGSLIETAAIVWKNIASAKDQR